MLCLSLRYALGRFVIDADPAALALSDWPGGDTYQPIDPATLSARLKDAGFTDVEGRLNEYDWAAMARRT